MNKQEMVARIADKLETSQAEAERVLKAVLGVLEEVFQQDKPLVLTGFVTIGSRIRAARTGRNPSTGTSLVIPASRVPYLKAGSRLKALLNERVSKEKPS